MTYIRKAKLFSTNPISVESKAFFNDFDRESLEVHERCESEGFTPVDTKVVATQGKIVMIITGVMKIRDNYREDYQDLSNEYRGEL